ncbi:efflux RND transporter permease subunit [Marinomonas sp. PE14-40]|uniref:efflux RND transporter permease subunit n=1 Tax=Marinomonas sp. PE14-40 TaxID=3060621 RepID=UPI003F6621B2
MVNIINAALSRSRTVLMFFVLLLAMGISSYFNIAKEEEPDITIPTIYVSISLDGISPEDSDSLLVHPMEKELKSIEGLDKISSTASEGHASITLEFDSNTDIDQALVDVKDKVDTAKADLPDDADEPTVNEINLSTFPVLQVTLHGDVEFGTLSRIANDLQDDIEAAEGVLEAEISGDREDLAEIIISPDALESYNLNLTDVVSTFNDSNQLVAAGTLDTGSGRFSLKVPGLLKTSDDIFNLPMKVDGDRVVLLKDIATGQMTYKDATSYARLDGKSSITLGVSKRVGGNTINMIAAVKEVIAEESKKWPEGVQYSLSQDESVSILQSLNDLFNNVIFATLLVMIVIVAFLGLRTSVLVGIAIPGAFLMGILFLHLQGYTMNMVVLFGLILSVGMLVDGAIVVTEYADRKLAEGASKQQAYSEAAQRMAWPITASTATTLAVFMPLLYWPDIVGEFMRYMPITVIATLTSSLVMALVVIPTIGSIIGKKGTYTPATERTLKLTESGDLTQLKGLTGAYTRLLSFFVKGPWLVLAFCLMLLVSVFMSYGQFGKGVEFFPESEPDIANLEIRARGDLSLDEKDEIVRQVESLVIGHPDLKSVITTTTASPGNQSSPDSIGTLSLEFVDWHSRVPAEAILSKIREETDKIPGIIVEAEVKQDGPQSGTDIELELSSDYSELLNLTADRLVEELGQRNEIVTVNDDRSLPGIEWQIDIDRAQAQRFDVSVATLGNAIKLVTNGITLSDFLPEGADDEIDIVLRYPVNQRSLEQLDNIMIPSNVGPIPVSNFIHRKAAPKQGQINRVDGKKVVNISADVKDGLVVDQVIKAIAAEMEASGIPSDIDYQFRGNTEDQQKSQTFLMNAFGIAFFMMAIILVTQFNNFFQCLLILSAVVFSTMGVLVGLMAKGEPFGIVMSGVGVIALAGIVVNNNIVLIDTFNGLRAQGMMVVEAAVRTGAQRLRPVLLTTVTTILGLMPMVFQLNVDLMNQSISIGAPSSQMWTQLSTAIAGGLLFATPLTLLLTPCLLVLGYRRKERKLQKALAAQSNDDLAPQA